MARKKLTPEEEQPKNRPEEELPTELTRTAEAEEDDWGFRELTHEAPETDREAGIERPKGVRDQFYELKFNELDRDFGNEERQEWNSIYASYRGHSAITGTIIGVDKYIKHLTRAEAGTVANQEELCAVMLAHRVPILIRESEMWKRGEERPDYVLKNMVGASSPR